MNILDQIIEHKRRELLIRKQAVPLKDLEQGPFFSRKTLSLKNSVLQQNGCGIIAEFKRKSPSKGVINADAPVVETTRGYANAGASGLSVLTDEAFFGGTNEDLIKARRSNSIPVLRKDFTIDEYQIAEAKAIGADAILLIAAVLDPCLSKSLAAFAHSLGLEVLLEVHNESELLASIDAGADLIGVNNRDLKTFSVSIETSKKLVRHIPSSVVKVSESGISDVAAIVELMEVGFDGFLIGENFMKQADPAGASRQFMADLHRVKALNRQ